MAKITALEIEMLSMKSERMADANLLTKHKTGEIILTPAPFAAIRRRTADRTARYDLIVTTLDHAEGR